MVSQNNPTKSNDDDMMTQLMQPLPTFMTVVRNDTHQRVELHLRGEFRSPQESTRELTELSMLSEKYTTCLVYINSVGGRVDLLREIVAMLDKFESVITVVTSQASSAGLMLWAEGDLRVVCPHAELMAHRETSGYLDKTDALLAHAEFLKRRFELMFTECFEGILTEEEIARARLTEVWLLGQDMIDRGVAISWEQFHAMDVMPLEGMPVFHRGGKTYVRSSHGEFFEATVEVDDGKLVSFLDVIYGVENPREISLREVEETDELVESEEEALDDQLIDFGGKEFLSEDEVRCVLRQAFGKGGYQIKKKVSWLPFSESWEIRVKDNGKFEEFLYVTNSHSDPSLPAKVLAAAFFKYGFEVKR